MLTVFIVCGSPVTHIYILCLMAMDFLLAGDRATRRGEGCSRIERPLARFELERTREQKKPYLAKRTSWRRHSQSLSERLGNTYDTGFISSDAQLSCVTVTNASPTTVSLPVSISQLYLSLSGLQQQMQKRLYISISFIPHMVRPNY